MKLVLGLADRILFALGLLLALQIPHFLDHYTQRYAGYRDALADSMAEFQRTADQHYGGNLQALIDDLRAGKPGIEAVGDKLDRDRRQLAEMDANLVILREGGLWARVQHLARNADSSLVRGAWGDYQPGLPLTTDALICGALGALLATGLFNALVWLIGWPFRTRYTRLKYD
ncbi:MAG TPA: DUF2937 family protein [Solimonas sp.]